MSFVIAYRQYFGTAFNDYDVAIIAIVVII